MNGRELTHLAWATAHLLVCVLAQDGVGYLSAILLAGNGIAAIVRMACAIVAIEGDAR